MDSRGYLFVNFTPDKTSKDRRTAKDIRTYVMQDIGKARRKTRKNVRVPLKLRSSPPPWAPSIIDMASVAGHVNHTVRSLQDEDLEVDSHTSERSAGGSLPRPFWTQNPLQILDDCWGMDPFALYAVALAVNASSSYAGLSQRPQYFLFPFAPANSPSFRDLLTSPYMRDAVVRDSREGTSICQRRYASGLRCIKSSIVGMSPRASLKTPVMLAIIGLICYNYLCEDFAQAEVHFAGLRGIIDLGGGPGSLSAQVRLMIMWIDVTAALMRDYPPHYALPVDLLPILPPLPPESSRQMETTAALMLSISPEMSSVVDVYHDLKRLAAWFEAQSAMLGIERDTLSVSLFLDPIAHRALSDCAPIISSTSSPLAKACTLAAILIIISLRREYGSYPGTLSSYPMTITDALRDSETDGPEFLRLRLWLLIIAGISTTEQNERQAAQVRLVAEMREAGLQNWRSVKDLISPMPWFNGLWEEEYMLLGEDVMSKLHLSGTATCGISYDPVA